MQTLLPKRLTEHLLLMHLNVESKNRRLESVCPPWMHIGLSGASPRSKNRLFTTTLCIWHSVGWLNWSAKVFRDPKMCAAFRCLFSRAATTRTSHNTIRIAILASRYNTYHNIFYQDSLSGKWRRELNKNIFLALNFKTINNSLNSFLKED